MNFDENVIYLISVIAGFAGIPVVGLIKKLTGWSGKQALSAATLTSIVLAFISVAITGQLNGLEFSLETVVNSVGVVFGVATIFYKALQADK
ncbi:MAG: hypothetical protein HN929_09130 [Chloroflexi bacterium]|jgi:cytochrome c oxidase assembly protein Cox11|nr:hypothetical protein [Chloroflexota bacterium]